MKNGKRKTAGFTLVELIVVIAILAILAGVGTVAYSGYIKKANEAADQQLLSAVNTAFAAACVENGVSNRNLSGANLTINDDNTVRSVHGSNDSINASFAKYFAGNEDTAFKVFGGFLYNAADGVFVGSTIKITSQSNGGGTTTYTVTLSNGKEAIFTVDNTDIAKLGESTFCTQMTMGELMGDVGTVVNAAKAFLTGDDETNTESLIELIGEDFLEEVGLDANTATATQLSNVLVLKVAETSATWDAGSIMTNYNENGSFFGDEEEADLVSQLALMYGVMTGYANSDIGKTTNVTVDGQTMTVQQYYAKTASDLSDPMQVIEMMNIISESDGMDDYMTNYAQRDIAGYISAMGVISDNTETMAGSTDVLSNGFTDADIVALLNGIFGHS